MGTSGGIKQGAGLYFFLFAGVYLCLLILAANFSVVDDHLLTRTTLVGKFIPPFILPNTGRFYPLNGYEYNLVSLISDSPTAYYLFNAAELVIVLFALYKILVPAVFTEKQRGYAYLLMSGLLLLPGFATAWFRLFVPERNQLVFFLIFLASYLSFFKTGRWTSALLALVSANVALYYKEPGFLMLGAFVAFHLLLGWKETGTRQKALGAALLLSAVAFLGAYFFLVFAHRGGQLYGSAPGSPILFFAKNVFNFLLNDPFLILVLPTLIVYRVFAFFSRPAERLPLYDASLIAAFVYVLVFFKLNMSFAHYYLLPAYAFGIFGMAFFLFNQGYLKRVPVKIAVLASCFIFRATAISSQNSWPELGTPNLLIS